MFSNSSLTTRIAVGKLLGLVVGLIGFIFLPCFLAEASPLLRWGILFWYITLGFVVGISGVLTFHPVIKLPLPWWFRGALIGGWMNFVVVFFAYEPMLAMMVAVFGENGALNSPFWFALEGALIGLLIDLVATKTAGDGAAIAGR